MAKSKRKWLQLDWSKEGCLRAQDIPYDENTSIKNAIDNSSSSAPDDDFTNLDWADSISLTDEILIYDKSIGAYRKTTVSAIRGESETTSESSYTEQATTFTSSDDLYYVDVSHNLNSPLVSLTAFDSTSWLEVIPETVELIDDDSSRLWFTEDLGSLDILVLPYTSNSDEQYKETITSFSLVNGKYQADVVHSLDASPPIQISCYDSTSKELIIPYDIELISDSTAKLEFSVEPTSVDILVTSYNAMPYGYSDIVTNFTASEDQYYTDIIHSLNSRPLKICCYSTSNKDRKSVV